MSITLDDLSLLLVEPSTAQQMILSNHLKGMGVSQLQFARTIEEALAAVRILPPHAVLSAMHLPDGKGHQLLGQMRQDPDIEDVAFMLISSETRIHELEPIRQGGAVAILPKPCSQNDLICALNHTLDLLTQDNLVLESQDVEDIRALVVDDSSAARKFIAKVLGQVGIENVVVAKDGVEAAEKLDQHFFDIVFTDYNMPRMNGYELLTFIRSKSNQPSVPVIMITSETDGTRIAGVQQAGVSAIIDKPFELQRVRAILQGALEFE